MEGKGQVPKMPNAGKKLFVPPEERRDSVRVLCKPEQAGG